MMSCLTICTAEGFGDPGKWPAVPRKVFTEEENQVTLFEVLCVMFPLPSRLECKEELFLSPMAEHIGQG